MSSSRSVWVAGLRRCWTADCSAGGSARSRARLRGRHPTFQRQLRLLRSVETAPGIQTQADRAEMDMWSLGKEMLELSVMVAILGDTCSRAPALHHRPHAADQP